MPKAKVERPTMDQLIGSFIKGGKLKTLFSHYPNYIEGFDVKGRALLRIFRESGMGAIYSKYSGNCIAIRTKRKFFYIHNNMGLNPSGLEIRNMILKKLKATKTDYEDAPQTHLDRVMGEMIT